MPFDKDGNLILSQPLGYQQRPNVDVELGTYTKYLGENDYIKQPFDASKWNRQRAENQGFGAEVGNQVLKFVPKVAVGVINTVADIGDLSNWATTIAGADNSFNKFFGFDANPQNFITQMTASADEAIDEALPVYQKNNELFSPSDSAWWVSNIGGLIESVTEFGLTGFGIGKALGSLGKMARLNNSIKLAGVIDATQQGIGAAALTYAEGIQTGVDVYRQGLEKKNGLAPGSLKTSDISSFEPDAELADQAAEAVRWNFLNLGLNYTSLAPAFRANKFSRGLVDDALKPLASETSEQYAKRLANVKPISVKNTVDEMLGFSKRKALGEVPQEALEEGVNVFAENQGKLAAGLIDESQAGFFNSILSEEGIMAMALGAVGGAGNTAVMNGLVNKLSGNNDKKIAQFNAQKNQIKENITESANVIRTVEQLSILQDRLQDAIISKDDNAVEVIKKQIVSSLALNNFENGTTEVFLEQLKSIANAKPEDLVAQGFAMNESPEAIAEARAYANQAINIVKENESLYNKIASENRELGNDYISKLFINRSMYTNTLENLDKANLKKTSTINTLNNEVRLNGIESTQGFAGNIDFYNTDNFTPKQLEVIKSLDSYKEALKAQDSAQDLQNTVQDLNDNYVKQTSKDYKKKLVKEQEEKDFQKQREAKRKRESEVLKQKQTKTAQKAKATQEEVKKTQEEKEYEQFVNTGNVSDTTLINIANKVKNREQLTEIENAIFVGKTEDINQIIAEGVTPEQDFKQMFRDALEDLTTDDTPAEKSIADRVAALERIVLAMGLNPATFTIQDVFNKYKESFADTPQYVSDTNRFNLLKSIVQAMQSIKQNPNFEDTVLAKLDPETLTLTGLQVKPDPDKRIPTSNPDNLALADKIREGQGEGQSNYKKIDDELSIAYMDVNYTVTDENGEIVYSDDYVNNQLNFNPSSVLSSSKIVVGDKVVLKVRGGSIDYNANTDPNKENNYPIDIYVDDVLVGTLHTPEYINKEKIADSRHLELDVMKENISKIRKQILASPDTEWQSTISDRKFGYFNLLKKGSFTTLAQAFKDDIRTGKVVLGIRQYGKFITNKAVNLYYTNDLAFEDGVGVVLIPHPTGDSKTPIEHVPMFIRTQQLKNEPTGKIYKLVEQAMTEFLNKKITAEQLKTRISPFIYTQIDSGLQNPGNWGVRIQGNSIIINNTRVSTIEDLKQNIGNIFVTLDTGALTGKHPTLKAKEYLEIISNSNLYQTDVHGREVKINNSVERTYFSQITTVISPDIKPFEAAPTLSTKETPREPIEIEAKKADIERRRQEELKNNQIITNPKKSDILFTDTGKEVSPKIITNGTIQGVVDSSFGETVLYNSLHKINPKEINTKYDAELAALNQAETLQTEEETELDTDLLLEENDLGLPTDDITVEDSEMKLQISDLVDLDLQYEAVESFAYMLLTNKDTSLGDNKQWLLNKLKDNLTTFKKYAKFERSPENKAKAEAVVERYNNIIGIYDALYDRAEVFLTELGLKPNTEGYYDTIEEIEETINQMVDNAAFKEDREAGASANIRKFLYFIPDVKEDGTNVRNKLGLYNFNDFKSTYNIIAFELAGKYYKSDASGKEKMFRLLSDSSSPILKKVAEKIKTESEQTQREFFMLFNQQHITYNTILFSILNEKTFYDKLTGTSTTYGQNVMANIINSDQVQAQQQIVKQWRGVFNTLPIVKQEVNKTSGEVNYVIDTEKGKELYDKLESIVKDKTKFSKNKLVNIDEVYDLVSSVIPISKEAFTDFLNYHLDVMGKRGNHVYLLNNNILRPLFTRISGKSKTDSGEDSETSRSNDPFDFESSTVKLLAKYEYLRSKNAHSATLRAGGNQYYSFVRPNPLYRLITQLKGEGGVNQFIADKRNTDVFFKPSYWAENLADVKDTSKEFYENFELLYEKGSEDKKRKYSFKELSQMTAKEFTLTDFWLFQNGGKAQAKIVLDTMSDKTTKPIQGVLRHEVNVDGTIDAGFTLDEKTLDILYRYFLSEYSRILAVQEQNKSLPESQRIQKYHDIGTKQGMGKYFLIYSFLNFDLAEEGSGVMGMYNEDGTIKEGLDKDDTIKELVKEQINKNFNNIAKALKQDVESLGLVGERTTGKRTYYSPTPLLDKRYYKKLAKRLSYLDKAVTDNQAMSIPQVTDRKKQIVDLALVEFLVNKAITSNEMLLLTGDPAQHGKPLRESADKAAWLLDSIKETFNNVSKRNARLLASGNTKYWPDSTYYVGMLSDEKVESPYIDEYVKSLKKLGYSEAEVKKGYENGDETDAQELTTVEEHLTDMLSSGEINDEEFKIYLGLWDPEAYTKKYKESPSKPSKEILKKAKNVLQPRKPVQVYGKLDPSLSITKQFYIKTSSFPLIPSVIKGNPIMENLLSQMKSKNVQRVAFQSGVKLGVTSPTKLTVNGKPNPDIFKNNIYELDRDGFAIQLEVPYDEAKEAIREGTQMMKLLFADMDETENIDIFGKSMTVGEAKKLYRKLHKDLFDIELNKLIKELAIQKDINGAYKITDMNKLSEILIEEGLDRGYSVNTLAGLKTVNGNFEVPLNYLSNVSAIEPVLISIVSNRLTKTKLPGKSYVQGSEIYTRDRVTSLEQLDERKKSSIIWTKPDYFSKSKLDFVRGNKNAPTSKAQIIMPFYFIDKEGNQIDTKNFIKDGLIDLSKIDEELLSINGFRIPTQGHNSMLVFEVVGFLPKEHGDLVIVPAEIVAQMGSDFDVDKLYTYHYNYNVGDKITKVSYVEDSMDSSEIKSGIVEINNAVILHPSNFTKLIEPLGSKDFDIIANKLPKPDKQWLGAYNPIYQRDEFFDNRGGQIGVGITANSNTQHANAQSSNLYIKEYGVVFSDENGDTYADEVRSNRVNSYRGGLYDYVDGEDIISMVGKLSAWRLDKINTFPSLVNPEGVRISTLISGDLGISVDNAKDKKLALGGVLSKYNLSVKELIHRAGFDNSWALPFINQPILKEYYEILGNLEDSVEMTYGKDKKQKAINELFTKYSTKFNVENPYVEKGLQPISQIELGVIKTDKGFDINIDTDVNEGNVTTQLNVLKHFLYYSDIATELASLTKEFNADVNGLPPTVVEVNKKAISPSKSPSIGNIEEYIENTINGVYYPATEIANELFSDKELFLHNTPAFTQVISNLLGTTSTNEFNGEDTNDIFNNIVNYTYSMYQPKDNSLIFDTDTNQSLYTRLLSLKTKYPRNFLLQYLNPISGNEVGEPKRIEMISSIGDKEKFMNKIIMNWSAMLYGTDAELKSFAEDLVKYTLTYAPQQYGQSSLIKYIPFKYFKDSGVTSFIKSIDFNSPDVFDNFNIQFVQHFPEYLPYFDHKLVADKKKTFKQDSKIIDTIELPPVTTEFKDNPVRDIIKQDKEGNFFYPPMIRVNNEEIGNIPYILDSSDSDAPVYRRVDKLGTKGFFEYTPTQIGSSVIPSNQAPFKSFPEQSQVKFKVSPVDDFFTNPTAESMLLQAKQGLAGDLKGLLANYISIDDTPVNIVLTDQVPYMRTSTDGSTIFINSEFIKEKVKNNTYSMEDIYTSLLHELIHVKTNLKLFSPEFQQTNEFANLKDCYDDYLKSIDSDEANTYKEAYKLSRELNKPFNDLLNNPTQDEIDTLSKRLSLPKNDISKYIKSFSADKRAAKSKYYANVSINEFVALAMTDEGFQSYLKTIPGKSSKSLWKEFVDAIIKIFGGNNLLAETIENVIDVIEYTKPNEVQESEDITTESEFSKLTKNQQVRLKNLGVSEEEFNSLIFEEQKQLIECYG